MDKKQEELMKEIKRMQKRTARKRNFARQVGYTLTVLLDAFLTWVVWNNLIVHISPFPELNFVAMIVLTLLMFSGIFIIASLVRTLLSNIKERKDD